MIVALIVDAHHECDSPPFRSWVIIQTILQSMMLVGTFYHLYATRYGSADHQVLFFTRMLNFIALMWFSIGVSWLFQKSHTCANTAPVLYKAAVIVILVEGLILGILLIILCCSLPILYILYVWGPSNFPARFQPFDTPSSNGAEIKVINAFTTTKKYEDMKFQEAEEDRTCAICLIEYKIGDEIRELPCRHYFHSNCITTWLRDYRKWCPFCKTNIDNVQLPPTPKGSTPG